MLHLCILLLSLTAISQGQDAAAPCTLKDTRNHKIYLQCTGISDVSMATTSLATDQKIFKIDIVDSPQLSNKTKLFENPAFEHLETLILRNSNLTSIESVTSSSLPHLGRLYLEYNEILGIHGTPFKKYANLTILHLNGNNLTKISNQSFSGLVKLESLSLGRNSIKSIDYRAFQKVPLLTSLRLDHNLLESLDHRLFANISLDDLDLQGNNMEQMTKFPLNIPSLTVLSLANCNIHSIPVDYFRKMPKLFGLDMEGNKLSAIEPGFMISFPRLHTLFLNDNQLTSLDVESFEQFHQLYVKTLTGNLGDLYILSMSDNPWNCESNGMMELRTWYEDHFYDYDKMFNCTDSN